MTYPGSKLVLHGQPQTHSQDYLGKQYPERQREIWFSMSSEHSAGIMTGTFLAPKTEPQRFFIIVPWAAVAHSFVLKSSIRLAACSRISPSDTNNTSALGNVYRFLIVRLLRPL